MKNMLSPLPLLRTLTAAILMLGLAVGATLISGCSTTDTAAGIAAADGDQAKGALAASKTGIAFGYVKDASTGARIGKAQVVAGSAKAYTDQYGNFTLTGVPFGRLTVTVSAESYQTAARIVSLYGKSVYLGAVSIKKESAKPSPTPIPPPAPNPNPVPSPAPTPVPSPAGLTANEQQMIDLVNKERTANGLKALIVDMNMVNIARNHSQEMIDRKYFDHISPVTGSPFDRLKAAGITYRYAGENIAGNQSVSAAHTSLMNSAGHRANILNGNYTHVGIGIRAGGPYGLMFTQLFIGK